MTTTAEFVRTVLKAVPAHNSHEHVDSVIDTFMATYPAKDVETRLALFADDAIMEDPVGRRVANNKVELRTFFEQTIAGGSQISMKCVRRLFIADEAVQLTSLVLQRQDLEPANLTTIKYFAFNEQGLITALRVFMDVDEVE